MSIASTQLGLLKIAGQSAEIKPVERVELVLGGAGRVYLSVNGKYVVVKESDVAKVVKGKAVVLHTATRVMTASYGSDYIRIMTLMSEAKTISPGSPVDLQ